MANKQDINNHDQIKDGNSDSNTQTNPSSYPQHPQYPPYPQYPPTYYQQPRHPYYPPPPNPYYVPPPPPHPYFQPPPPNAHPPYYQQPHHQQQEYVSTSSYPSSEQYLNNYLHKTQPQSIPFARNTNYSSIHILKKSSIHKQILLIQ